MKSVWSTMVGLAAVASATNISLAAINLATWDIYSSKEYAAVDNTDHTQDGGYATVSPQTPAAHVTASAISRGRNWAADIWHPAWQNKGAGLFVSHSGWISKSAETAVSEDRYFEFSVAAADGFALNLSSVGLSLYQQDPNSAATVFVKYSLDNFATSTALPEIKNIPSPWWGSVIADVSLANQPSLQNVTGPVTFRVYGYNFTNADAGLGRAGGANTDARVVGDVVAVPEVASAGLLLAGVISLARSRKSSRPWS